MRPPFWHTCAPRAPSGSGRRPCWRWATRTGWNTSPSSPRGGLSPAPERSRQLGQVVATAPIFALDGVRRLEHLADFLIAEAPTPGVVGAPAILAAVLQWLGPIWPGRHTLAGANLGDV